MKTKTISSFIIMLLCCYAAIAADPQPTPIPGSYVHDFANVIDASKRAEINEKAKTLKEKYKTEIAVVTITSLGGEDIFDYSMRMARSWGIGSKDNEIRGLLIVVAVQDRKTGFRTSRHIEGELPDGVTGSINRTMGQYFKRGDFGGGLSAGMDAILAREAEVFAPPSSAPRPATQGRSAAWLLLLLIPVGGTVLVFWMLARRRRRREDEAWSTAKSYRSGVVLPTPVIQPPSNLGTRSVTPRSVRTGTSSARRRTQSSYTPPPPRDDDYVPSSSSSYSSSSSSSSSSSDSGSSYSSDSGSSYSGGSDFGGGGSDSSW